VFSIFTESTGRCSDAPLGSGRPVNGAVGGAGAVVVVGAAVVVVVFGLSADELPPPHDAATSASRTGPTNNDERRRRTRELLRQTNGDAIRATDPHDLLFRAAVPGRAGGEPPRPSITVDQGRS
jgi:hypothetical protein